MKRLAAAALAAIAMIAGCASDAQRGAIQVSDDATLPSYEQVAERYNQRTALLGRVWARAVVEMRFLDAEGRRKSEQGEGHLQFIAPSRFALSVGKLGEVLLYLGCDDHRFWWFERGDANRVSVCRHANADQPCAEGVGLPARPLEVIELMGVLELPARGGRVQRSARGEIVVDVPSRTAQGAFTRVALDPSRYEPTMIGLYDTGRAQPVLLARLEEYANVSISGRGGIPPRVASRIVITHAESDTEIRLSLAAMTDGVREGRMPPEAFDFEALRRAFAPGEVRVLDAACPSPALPSGR
ncbi:MAG: hypothetical protein ACTS27_03110 [Phycisphaerales bacterium]